MNPEKGEAGLRNPRDSVMKKTIGLRMVLTALVLIVLLAGGTTSVCAKTKKTKAKYSLSQTNITIKQGERVSLSLRNSKGKVVKPTKVKWSSANKKVAKVSKKGVVEGVFTGEGKKTKKRTFIYAKYKGKTYKCTVLARRSKYSEKTKKPKTFEEILNKNGSFKLESKKGLMSSLTDGKQKVVRSGYLPSNVFKEFACGGLTFSIVGDVSDGEVGPKPLPETNGKRYMPFERIENGAQDYTYDIFYDKDETTHYGERFQLVCDKESEYDDEGSKFMNVAKKDFKKNARLTCDKCPTYDEKKSKKHRKGEKCVVTYGSYGTLIPKCLNFETGETFVLTLSYRGVSFSVTCICVDNLQNGS